jgi:hypothetical protein
MNAQGTCEIGLWDYTEDFELTLYVQNLYKWFVLVFHLQCAHEGARLGIAHMVNFLNRKQSFIVQTIKAFMCDGGPEKTRSILVNLVKYTRTKCTCFKFILIVVPSDACSSVLFFD